MLKRSLTLFLIVFAALTLGVHADTVVLKTGEKIEGKILAETDAQLTIEVVAGGVVDERVVQKADIAKVEKIGPDEIAWKPLSAIKLGDDSLPTADQYDAWLGPLNGFIKEFAESTYRSAAEKLAGEIDAEKSRVANGEAKLNGRWLSKDEVQRERYQISGSIAANYMRAQATRGDSVGAMNTFDIIEKQFDGSRGYLEAVVLARQIVPPLKAAAAQRLAALPAENTAREQGVKAAAGLDQVQLQKELDTEKKNNETAMADAKKAGLKWPPFLRRSEPSMKEILKLAEETEKRLISIDLAKAGESIKLAEEVRADLDAKKLEDAEKKLRQAQTLWQKNELVVRLNKELAGAKTVAMAAAAEAETAKAEVKATPAPTPRTSVPKVEPAIVAPIEDEEPKNPIAIFVIGVVVAALAFVAWTAYKKVVKKSNEIIE
ncbi:MAG: PTPDL family protein [Chthoniobacteraceae bacterium]